MNRAALAARMRTLAASRFAREFVHFTGSTLLLQASRLLVSLAAAAQLGPERWGYWFLLNLMLTYGSVFHLGATNGMNREVPIHRGRGDASRVEEVQGVAFAGVVVGAAFGAAALLAATALPAASVLRVALPSMAVLFTVTQVYAYLQARLKSEARFRAMSVQQIAYALLLPVVVLPLAGTWGLAGFILGQAAVAGVVAAGLMLDPATTLRLRFSWPAWRRLVGIGWPIMLAGLLYALLTTVDRWVVGAFLGIEALGHYSLAILVLGVLALVPRVIGQQVYPRMAEAYGRTGDPAEVRRWARRQSRVATAVSLPLAAAVALVAPFGVGTFLPEYAPGVTAMQIVLVGPVLQSLAAGYGNLLNTVGRQRTYLLAQGVGVGTNLILSPSLVLLGFGLEGVALATAASYGVYALMVRWAGLAATRS